MKGQGWGKAIKFSFELVNFKLPVRSANGDVK